MSLDYLRTALQDPNQMERELISVEKEMLRRLEVDANPGFFKRFRIRRLRRCIQKRENKIRRRNSGW